jgi:hypothetical protein
MRLKVACWAFAALTFAVLIGWPAIVGKPPKGAPRRELKQYARKAEVAFGVMVGSFLVTTVLAGLVVRQYRQEFMQESAENLKMLVEGTLEDHRKKSGAGSEEA